MTCASSLSRSPPGSPKAPTRPRSPGPAPPKRSGRRNRPPPAAGPEAESAMTTPRDLLIVALDTDGMKSGRSLEAGDLSLALAGAELIDLLDAQAIRLDGDDIVPDSPSPVIPDRLLDQAASSLVRQTPYESVDDWLWRRGRDLATAYRTALETEGQLTLPPRRWTTLRTGRTVLADTPARRQAADRWTAHEPVLTALAAAAGIDE